MAGLVLSVYCIMLDGPVSDQGNRLFFSIVLFNDQNKLIR